MNLTIICWHIGTVDKLSFGYFDYPHFLQDLNDERRGTTFEELILINLRIVDFVQHHQLMSVIHMVNKVKVVRKPRKS